MYDSTLTEKNRESVKPDRVLDVIGFFCPEPMFRTRMEIDEMKKGEVLEVLSDDQAAESDIKSWARKTGNEILSIEKDKDDIRFMIRKIR
jgi:tRNA 2-thiouridine synthesizing protein A